MQTSSYFFRDAELLLSTAFSKLLPFCNENQKPTKLLWLQHFYPGMC